MTNQGYQTKVYSVASVYTGIKAIPSVCLHSTTEQKWQYLVRSKVHLIASCLWQWL